MNVKYLLIAVIFLLSHVVVVAQNDTITGVLLDINQKAIKKYPVALGRVSPVRVKTDKNGFFIIPNANLQDTLFVANKNGKNMVAIPINGYRFVSIQSLTGDFNAQYLSDPNERLIRHVQEQIRQNAKKKNVSLLNRVEIEQSGCRDVTCLLRRFNGVTITEDLITIRGTSSLQGASSPLFVIDGIASTESSALYSIAIEDIEEISVLKDASMYGVRGANGAIVVRTR